MAEAFFNRVADDVLMATEQLQALLTTGSLSLQQQHHDDGAGGGGESTAAIAVEFEWNDNNMDLDSLSEEEIQRLLEQEDMMEHSPLKGIADGVIGNIASSQVRKKAPQNSKPSLVHCFVWVVLMFVVVMRVVFVCDLTKTILLKHDRLDLKHRGNTWMPFEQPSHGQNPSFWV